MGRRIIWIFPVCLIAWHGCMGASRQTIRAEQAKERFARASQYLAMGAAGHAIRELAEAVKLDPANAELHNALALAYHLEGKYQLALVHYDQALQRSPSYAEAHVNLGALYLDLGRWDEAIAHGREAIKDATYRHPEKAYNNVGLAYIGKGDLIAARVAFRKALALDDHFPEAHRHLGMVYFQQGQIDAAIRELRAALRVRPNYADALVDLGVAYLERGSRAEAVAQFQRVIQLDPESELAELAQWYLGTVP